MSSPHWFSRLVIGIVAFTLCGGPQLVSAQQPTTQQTPQSNESVSDQPTQQRNDQQNATQQNVGTSQDSATPDPSKGPLKPNDNQLPNAPSASQQEQTSTSKQAQEPQGKEAPLGAAAAQAGKTSGGAASRPAGTAIAPAKQRQTRSLLIKFGAIAAGAAALGIVYGLTRATSSVPPGATTTTTTSAAH